MGAFDIDAEKPYKIKSIVTRKLEGMYRFHYYLCRQLKGGGTEIFMCFNNKFSRKKYVVFLGIASLVILCIVIKCLIEPIHLSNKRISKIDIELQMSSLDLSVVGYATIDDEKAIKEAIGILNDIQVIPGKYSVYDLEGDSPSAEIMIYDGNKVVDSIGIYYDIVAYNGNFYKISISQYNKLIDLCRQYGDVYE